MFKTDIAIIITNLKEQVKSFDRITCRVWTELLDELLSCVKHDDWHAATKSIEIMEVLLKCVTFDEWPHGPQFSTTAGSGLRVVRSFVTTSAIEENYRD